MQKYQLVVRSHQLHPPSGCSRLCWCRSNDTLISLSFPLVASVQSFPEEASVFPAVENLRHLILWSLLPGHTVKTQAAGEPEDDLTPTPSVVSITSHPWDPGSPGQAPAISDNTQFPRPEGSQPEGEDVALCSLAHLPPRTRNSGIWDSPELDRNPAEEASSSEPAGSYKVVRKGKLCLCVHCAQTFAGVEVSVTGRHLLHPSPRY
jgi:hypothetical protein